MFKARQNTHCIPRSQHHLPPSSTRQRPIAMEDISFRVKSLATANVYPKRRFINTTTRFIIDNFTASYEAEVLSVIAPRGRLLLTLPLILGHTMLFRFVRARRRLCWREVIMARLSCPRRRHACRWTQRWRRCHLRKNFRRRSSTDAS